MVLQCSGAGCWEKLLCEEETISWRLLDKLRIHSITATAALKFESEAWVLKKREEQRLEAAQMKFLRQLLEIAKLDKEKNQCIS
jgi:hypothetical protein